MYVYDHILFRTMEEAHAYFDKFVAPEYLDDEEHFYEWLGGKTDLDYDDLDSLPQKVIDKYKARRKEELWELWITDSFFDDIHVLWVDFWQGGEFK